MFSVFTNLMLFPVAIISILTLFRVFLHRTALILVLKKWYHRFEDRVHVHQLFKVPEFNQHAQPNHFYTKVSAYLNSLPSIEDSDSTNLVAGKKPNDIILCLDDNQTVHDDFLGARLAWLNQVTVEGEDENNNNNRRRNNTFVLRIKRKDKRRILRAYIQHIHTVSDEAEQRRRRDERKLYLNGGNGRWRSVPFTSPSTMDTLVIDMDLKSKVRSDLESFLKSRHYYHRLGRAWRRSYLLHGPSGTGKSSFISAVANSLSYDVYDLDLLRVADDSELKALLLKTTAKSVIVVEDLDRWFLREREKPVTATTTGGGVSLSGVLNFMDGITTSCCSDERLFVFTASRKDLMDPDMLRPGRVDVHIHFPLCDFGSFKSLASSYLGVKDHKLFPQAEEVFSAAGAAAMSAAEIGEIMISNRSSPSRAIKTVISALQTNADVAKGTRRLSWTASSKRSANGEEVESGGMAPVKELPRKLYGLLRLKSSNKIGPLDHNNNNNNDHPTKEDISR